MTRCAHLFDFYIVLEELMNVSHILKSLTESYQKHLPNLDTTMLWAYTISMELFKLVFK